MSLAARDPRPGLLSCICDGFDLAPANDNGARPVGATGLAAGFACAVLGQTLAATALPLAGLMLAPREAMATWPFAAMMLGALLGSFPAAFLRDAFGRRAGFALGASLGLAGGALLAAGLLYRAFAFACLGGLWLGMAQGFSFFYRHEAAAFARRPGAAAAGVLSGGLLAALLGPVLAQSAEAFAAPYALVGTALVTCLAHLAALAVAVRLAPDPVSAGPRPPEPALRTIVAPTALAAVSWFTMSALMAGSPLKLVACGVSEGLIFGFVAVHVLAMYAPAVPIAFAGSRLPPSGLAAAGAAAGVAALCLAAVGTDVPALLMGALVLSGAGWCAATTGAVGWMHEAGRPGRLALALHDGTLFLFALAGAASGALL